MKKRLSIWDILAWVCLAGIVIWLILKMAGIINTPIWLEYAPLLGAMYLAGWAMNKLDTATGDIRYLKEDVKKMAVDLSDIRNKCPRIISKRC